MASVEKPEKLSGAFGILGLLLLSYPLLQIFNFDIFVIGVPLLFFYIFGVWIMAIIGLYAVSRQFIPPGPPDKKEPGGHD